MNVVATLFVASATPMALIAALASTGAVVLIILGVSRQRNDAVQERLSKLSAGRPVVQSLEEIELSRSFGERILLPILRRSTQILQRYTPGTQVDTIRRRLLLAGNPRRITVETYLGLKGILAVAIAVVSVGMMLLLPPLIPPSDLAHLALAALVGLVAGFFLPDMWINSETGKRKKIIQKALPDTIDILTISVEAGLGFDAAMSRLTQKASNPLIDEFEKYLLEVRLGKSRRESLREIINRTGVDDVSIFIGAIIQADQLGVSMVKILRTQSEQMRMRRRQRAEKLAQEAPLKMILAMMLFIFPSVFVVVLGPAIPVLMKGL